MRAKVEASAPQHFFCPIAMHIMRDPVVLSTGQTYDHPSIERWLSEGHTKCPITGVELPTPVSMAPNLVLRQSIEEWAARRAPWLLLSIAGSHGSLRSLAGPGPDPALLSSYSAAPPASDPYASAQSQGGGVALIPMPAPREPSAPFFDPLPARRHGPLGRAVVTCQVVLLVSVWITLYILSVWQAGWSLADLAVNPWAGANPRALLAVGAQSHGYVASRGQGWRVLTSPFVPAGIIQLVPNVMLLSTFVRYLERTLPLPPVTIPAIFLVGSWCGAVTDANLNVYYVSSGASAGVAALLAAMWVEQSVNFSRYQLHAVSYLVLFIVTGVLGTLSVLPMQSFWYLAAAFAAGATLTGVILGLQTVMSKHNSSRLRVVAVALAAALLVGGAVAGALGVGLDTSVGTTCGEACVKLSCAPLQWWTCAPSPTYWYNGCGFGQSSAGEGFIQCPTGLQISLADEDVDVEGLSSVQAGSLCSSLCSASDGSASPSPSSPTSTTLAGEGVASPPPPPPATGSTGTTPGGSLQTTSVSPAHAASPVLV
ncbi:hypothetical protein APUTEX25_000605 [Auxenochlorella protothecoides]|uniref:U-box domain-containing protein n=1 Tax=Auxenochlorella protothecoides TaxID=3075 RepID=A0A3M7KWM0_AUXPR|nr:hypothetical protein APUTEX25_000605 [Auxenochlorella protothecoides]|eukprot:RMZ54254.1 hypothetical protein APUTEX25_000605 [Auxenochlorella protothecoides]